MNEKMLDRIRKLMRLAADKGATQEEAESALLMAQRLMIEHGLAEAEVWETPTPEEMLIEEGVVEDIGRTEGWRGLLATTISKNFRCSSFWNVIHSMPGMSRTGKRFRSQLVIIGHAGDVEIAKEVYRAAVEVALREVGLFLKEQGRTGSRQDPVGREMWNSFLWGFNVGLGVKYSEQVKANGWELAIVTPEDVKRRLEALHLTRLNHDVSMENVEAIERGVEAGKQFEPRRKMKAAKSSSELAVRNNKKGK